MVVTHEPWIVALSVLVAIQGAYVGLTLVLELPHSLGSRRKLLLAGAAGTLAVAIWSMHFVGMLAVESPVPIEFLVLPTLISFLVCAMMVGLAVFLASSAPASKPVLVISAVVMGAGIVIMHFIGMIALHSNAMTHHSPAYVIASFLIGVTASGLALHFAFHETIRPPLVAASIALGLAIAGMHYTAMAGMTLDPLLCGAGGSGSTTGSLGEPCNIAIIGTAISRDFLAVIVAIVAFGTSSAFLLALVPDGTPDASSRDAGRSAAFFQPGVTGALGMAVPQHAGIAAEASGQAMPSGPFIPQAQASADSARPAVRPAVLPVEKEGATHYLPIANVKAVRAEAHYTNVFDGTHTFFCTLSISDVESRLDKSRFIRVHRSHIVAVDHVASLKKSGDGAVAQLDSSMPYSLPVSRRKLSALRSILDGRA